MQTIRTTILLFVSLIGLAQCFEVPCTEKLVGGFCNVDEECYGTNTICLFNRCSCPTNFEEYTTSDNPQRRLCRPAPDTLNAPCQTDCKPPYTCRDGKCDCWGSGSSYQNGVCKIECPAGTERYGAQCRKISHFNQQCTEDIECVDPLNECRSNRCQCAAGTRQVGSECRPTCPDGNWPAQSCRRLFLNDVDMLEHKANGDTCDSNHYCATYGKPGIGHCCKIYCPYGDADDKSCDAGASASTKCRTLTHFCHTIKAPGYSKSICCPRPCREPTPLYLDGKCMTMAHLGDLCARDEQCEGGVKMSCSNSTKRCICRAGFNELRTGRFPTCTATCGPVMVPVADVCLPKVKIGGQCVADAQCDSCGMCYNGVCDCKCGMQRQTSRIDRNTITCVNPNGGSGLDFSKIFQTGGIQELLSGGLTGSCGGGFRF